MKPGFPLFLRSKTGAPVQENVNLIILGDELSITTDDGYNETFLKHRIDCDWFTFLSECESAPSVITTRVQTLGGWGWWIEAS